jgi:Uncharacterized conserved protein
MAVVKPFKGIRPRPDLASRIAALPYDVYNREEAKQVVAKEPLSFLKIDRAETQFADNVSTYDPCVYEKASEMLEEMIADGSFIQDAKECYYLYELTMNGKSQTGIVGRASIDDYDNNIIMKHENTRAEKERDRINHVDKLDAQTGPIFLAYHEDVTLKSIIEATKKTDSEYDFISDDGIRHRVWKIADEMTVKQIVAAFNDINSIYIADGHHRCASAVKVGKKRRSEKPNFTGEEDFNFFLSVLFQDSELYIMDYNRAIKDLNGLSEAEFMARVQERFNISTALEKTVSPDCKGCFGMYFDGKWYRLDIKDEYRNDDPVKGLDVSLLQDNLLQPVLGIDDPKVDDRIDFIGGIRGLEELEKRVGHDCKVAFSMYPTSIQELFDVADANKLMPPKSTWFEPKLRSGLFIHKLS